MINHDLSSLNAARIPGFLYSAPIVLPAVPMVSRQSCGHSLVNGNRELSGPQRGSFARVSYSLS
jgi:hypothetical protein